ncbi:hypothetical protein [Cystobacter ferrugineus]|uniref:Uncharacterized protein n=1 Tax=Cystobacter ferrugineus TaxID=83449 RepID=A0A1L9B015_9BACT|nr:hypothetical protein [Cystobacter ferrugineus]OJH35503.1 hypothetical protein BON30_38910 [Cystobacter ferrugineus]
MKAVLLGLVLILPVTARGEISKSVRTYLLSTSRLIEDLEYERALEQINRAKKMAQGPDDDVALSLYEGIVLAELGRGKQDESNAAFKAALFLDPDATLPLLVSPKLKRRFEQVRKQVQRELTEKNKEESPASKVVPSTVAPSPQSPAQPLLAQPATEVSSRGAGLRSHALIPAIAGGALVVAGGVSWALAHGQKSKLRDPDSPFLSRADVEEVASRGRTYQTLGVGMLAVGVVGLGVATGMYLLGAPGESMSLRLGTDGTSAFVSGRWP